MPSKYRNFFLLHFIVFLWGWTAILGKLITISSTGIVWYRIIIGVTAIYAYIRLLKLPMKIPSGTVLKFFGVGIIIAMHWVFFYESIKVSTASVPLTCLASGTLFASILEPLFFRRKIIPLEIILGIVVISGIYMIFQFESKYVLGIIYGIVAAFLCSLFTVINGILVRDNDSRVMTFYELFGGLAGMTIYMCFTGEMGPDLFILSGWNWFFLMLLGLICTAFTFAAGVEVMREINPFTVVLTLNLEPVYGIILAVLLFGKEEQMTTGFYIGSLVVLATVFANGILKKKFSR